MTDKKHDKKKNIKFWHYPYNLNNEEQNKYLKEVSNEITDWINMFKIIKSRFPELRIFVKGGAVIGLKVLSAIPRKDQNYENFIKFYDLKLIKDWDFAIIIPPKYDKYNYEKNVSMCKQGLYQEFFKIVKRQNNIIKFNSEGSIICIVRHNNKKFVFNNNNDVLLESSISIKNNIYEKITDTEAPLTAMYYELGNENEINNFFNVVFLYTLITIILSYDSQDLNKKFGLEQKIKYIYNYVNNLNILIPFCKKDIKSIQYYKYGQSSIDYNKMIDDFAKKNKLSLHDKQFIITITCDMIRLLIRYNKNYNKSLMISEFLDTFKVKKFCWYITDYNHNITNCKNFMNYLYNRLFKEDYDMFFRLFNKNIENIINEKKYELENLSNYEYDIISSLNNNSMMIDKFNTIFNKLNTLFNLLGIVRVRDFIKRNMDNEYINEFIAFINYILEVFLFNQKLKYNISVYKLDNSKINKYVIYDLFSITDNFKKY
ncbi:hypothetical protein Hokovirus_1_198 [Hokovirus HKV1]|uniref:Uncharacterized protein n=1 Tax=Hokovirus HKV1 TaxID=1977638 RepID=A0A1V0SF15_9VIRU|nr:hypothetical protein Hokovirus_1_198 [Hokovirus HKV1]